MYYRQVFVLLKCKLTNKIRNDKKSRPNCEEIKRHFSKIKRRFILPKRRFSRSKRRVDFVFRNTTKFACRKKISIFAKPHSKTKNSENKVWQR